MKFAYEYRTPDNARHAGIVEASDREAAFQTLKSQGIKPGRLTEAPGFFNALFGKGKRWLAIGVLCALCLALCALVVNYNQQLTTNNQQLLSEDRAQLFGDPAVLQKLARNGWRDTFSNEGEAWLARHAIPGKLCDCPKEGMWRHEIADALISRKDIPIAILDTDSVELRKMKRMVNGMKQEFSDYVDSESDVLDFIDKTCERCRVEKGVADRISEEIARLEKRLENEDADRTVIFKDWDKKNDTLRSLGLSTIPQPE